MSDVFISYARKDQAWAEQLSSALKQFGLDVWWDAELSIGGRFSNELQSKLENSKAVIVLWSQNSINSTFVTDEASYARDMGKLVPVSIDGSPIPLGFRQFQTVQLQGWRGDTTSELIVNIAERISQIVGIETKPPQQIKEKQWLTVPKEIARRHKLYGFDGVLLAIYLAMIVNFCVSVVVQISVRDSMILQIRQQTFNAQQAISMGWAPPERFLEVMLYGLIVQAFLFVPFLLLPFLRFSIMPYIAAAGVFIGQLLYPVLWLPLVQPISSYLLPQVQPILLVSGVSYYLVMSDRVRVTYARQVRNELY